MITDLFDNRPTKPQTSINICDEIKYHKNREDGQWFYIVILLIPEKNKERALEKLNEASLFCLNHYFLQHYYFCNNKL